MWGPKFLEATVPHTLLIFMFGEDLQGVAPTNFIVESTSSTALRCGSPDVAFGRAARSGLAGHAVGWPWKLGARPSHWGSTSWHKLRISDVMFGVALVAPIPSIDQSANIISRGTPFLGPGLVLASI